MRERVAYWDNLKFILITLMVVGHFIGCCNSPAIQSVIIFISLVHMPLFIFISGVFHQDKNIRERIISLMLIGLALKCVLSIIGVDQFTLFRENDTPWFMFALALFTLITYICRGTNKIIILIISIIIGCLIGYDDIVGNTQTLSRIIVWFPCYLIGNIIGKDNMMKVINNKYIRFLSIGAFISFCVICFLLQDTEYSFYKYQYFITPIYSYDNQPFYCNGWVRLIEYFIMGIVSLGFMCIIPQKSLGIITVFGSRTIQVYFWHLIIRFPIFALKIQYLFFSSWFKIMVYIALVIFLVFILSTKFFSFPTKQIMNMKKTV